MTESNKSFIPEKSDTKFELTEAEQAYLDSLLLWQEMSQRSTIMLGPPIP